MKGQLGRTVGRVLVAVIFVMGCIAFAQRARRSDSSTVVAQYDTRTTSRNRGPSSRAGVPDWSVEPAFRRDVFRFVRLRYNSSGRRRGWQRWRVDYPGADLNLSYRLEQLTSMRVDPEPIDIAIDDPELFDYPFVFMIDPRDLYLSHEEAQILRRYLLNGGFLMIDDFWGDRMWANLMGELEKVFPDRTWVSLDLDHSIFKLPYPFSIKPQVPSEDSAHRTKDQPDPYRTWEDEISWEEPKPAEYRAYFDDNNRIVLLICWNTDLSDGWEEEGVSQWFFENFSEKYSYPMGINIIFHALTH